MYMFLSIFTPSQGKGGAYCYGQQRVKRKLEGGWRGYWPLFPSLGTPSIWPSLCNPSSYLYSCPITVLFFPSPNSKAFSVLVTTPGPGPTTSGAPHVRSPLLSDSQPFWVWGETSTHWGSQILLLSYLCHPTRFSLEIPGSCTLHHVSRQSTGLPPPKSQFPS